MRVSSAAAAAAILSSFRDVSATVSIGGSTTQWPVTEFQSDAQMTDKPIALSTLGGVAARQVKFKIDHTYSQALSPYQASTAPAPLPLPMGTSVVVTINFWSGPNRTGAPLYSATIFTGSVIEIPVIDGVSDISIWAQDASYNLGSLVSLPGAGVVGVSGVDLTQDLYYSSLVLIDLLLRGSGQYLTAPPVLTGAARTAYTILSIPGVGGSIPDIGGVVQQYLNPGGGFVGIVSRSPGYFTPDVIGCNGAIFSQTVNMATASVQPFRLYRVDTWFKVTAGSSPDLVAGTPGGTAGSCPSIRVSGGDIRVSASGINDTVTTGLSVNDGGWHHINVTFNRPTTTQVNVSVVVDGGQTFTSSQTVSATQALFAGGLAADPGTWLMTAATGGSAVVWLEAFEVIFVPQGAIYNDPPDRAGQSAGMASSITPTLARLQAISPQTGLNAWQTIQAIAAAQGALCWFDEDGTFFFEPQSVWLARRLTAPSRAFDASMFSNLAFQLNADGLRKTVTANYRPVTAMTSTVAAPAYVETVLRTFAVGTTVTHITTPQLFINPAVPRVGASNALNNSWFVPVDATRVYDPAAPVLSSVSIVITPTSVGFDLTVNNGYTGPVTFWNPTPGTIPQGPALIIHGTSLITSPPIIASVTGNPHAKDDLQLPDNPWRQDAETAVRLCHSTALETFNIIPIISNIDLPGDPRLQLGDVVTLTDGRPNSLILTPGGVRCVVVDIAHNVSPTADYRMTLALRPAGPPTGWLLGVPGRSELASDTFLPIPG